MYSKDMLIGILLSSSKVEFIIERADDSKIGYRIKVSLIIRAERDFLLAVRRSLLQHSIQSSFKETEGVNRKKPILRIGGIKNLYKVTRLVPELPDSKDEWGMLRELVDIMSNAGHRTAEGLDRILRLKGVI